ncbi:hypothetical protein V2J09_021109 [Rumex salicifolius]
MVDFLFALNTATYLLNITPTTSLAMHTRHQTLFHQLPSYNHLRVVGCLCYLNLTAITKHKLEPRTRPCLRPTTPLDLDNQKVIISCHVIFDELVFPFNDADSGKSLISPSDDSEDVLPLILANPKLSSHLNLTIIGVLSNPSHRLGATTARPHPSHSPINSLPTHILTGTSTYTTTPSSATLPAFLTAPFHGDANDSDDPVSDPIGYISMAGAPQYLNFTRPDIIYATLDIELLCVSGHEPDLLVLQTSTDELHSGAEAEYRAVANAVAEACWLRNLLKELSSPLMYATVVFSDNVSPFSMSSTRSSISAPNTLKLTSTSYEKKSLSVRLRSSMCPRLASLLTSSPKGCPLLCSLSSVAVHAFEILLLRLRGC